MHYPCMGSHGDGKAVGVWRDHRTIHVSLHLLPYLLRGLGLALVAGGLALPDHVGLLDRQTGRGQHVSKRTRKHTTYTSRRHIKAPSMYAQDTITPQPQATRRARPHDTQRSVG
jgi:hypothetical protein